jgi:hypothetical protein
VDDCVLLLALVMVVCLTLHELQILGEGKPENQNCAMIFCFGECIQTVDMNQENHLAEAFKMRNLVRVRFTSDTEDIFFSPHSLNSSACE